jgi:uncharacterized membrane protein
VPTLLPLNGVDVFATAVNSSGTVVGFKRDRVSGESTYAEAWIFIGGAFEVLPTPAGYRGASPNAINDSGEIVGVADGLNGETAAVIWSADSLTPRILDAPATAGAYGIAPDGTVVGFAGADRYEAQGQPYVWAPDGAGRALDLPAGTTRGDVSRVSGAWATGTIGGSPVETDGGTSSHMNGALWNLRTGSVSPLDDQMAGLIPVNARGDVVLQHRASSVLVRDGVSSVLPFLPNDTWQTRSAPPTYSQAVAINESGTVIAGSHSSTSLDRATPAVVWHC